jgi:hypothetical protein
MYGRIEEIIANIGGDHEKWINGMSIVIAKYPVSDVNDKERTEFRTVFDPKYIKMYVPDPDGGVKIIQSPSLPPQEYVFDANVNMMGSDLVKATNIVIKNVKK